MIGEYDVTDLTGLGLSYVEITGPRFHALDVYAMIGSAGYMATFQFRRGSGAAEFFGSTLTGTVVYDLRVQKQLESGAEPDCSNLRIDSCDEWLSIEKRKKLKYQGALMGDLVKLSYFPYSQPIQHYPSGEKKISNIVEIEADLSGVDESNLVVSYLVMKMNAGDELIQFEKEKLAGTLLGMRNNRIDRRLLQHLGFDAEDAGKNINVRLAALRAKDKRSGLTKEENDLRSELQFIKNVDTLRAVMAELQSAGLSETMASEHGTVREVMREALKFRPSVLLHGKKQVFWDIASYAHIALRHLKAFQLASFRQKTPLPYRPGDLGRLIEKVLGSIDDEISHHFATQQGPFVRHGAMAVVFNGDRFHLRIDPDGRLAQFHSIDPTAGG